MQASSSAPALGTVTFDYKLPRHGIGATGPAPKVQFGHTEKDTGKYSSRLNQIIKQAEKVPGPGKYVAHEDWKMAKASRWGNGTRGYKTMHLNPPSTHYEAKDFATTKSIGCRSNVAGKPRTLYGKISNGKSFSMLDGCFRNGAKTPGPGAYSAELPSYNKGGVLWDKEKGKCKKMKVQVADIAPNHYQINYASTDHRMPNWSMPKDISR